MAGLPAMAMQHRSPASAPASARSLPVRSSSSPFTSRLIACRLSGEATAAARRDTTSGPNCLCGFSPPVTASRSPLSRSKSDAAMVVVPTSKAAASGLDDFNDGLPAGEHLADTNGEAPRIGRSGQELSGIRRRKRDQKPPRCLRVEQRQEEIGR